MTYCPQSRCLFLCHLNLSSSQNESRKGRNTRPLHFLLKWKSESRKNESLPFSVILELKLWAKILNLQLSVLFTSTSLFLFNFQFFFFFRIRKLNHNSNSKSKNKTVTETTTETSQNRPFGN